MLHIVAVAAALLLQAPGPHVGDLYELRSRSVSAQSASDGSSGDSHSSSMLIERVIAVRDAGVELEFDLPADASAEERARTWQFPVRVLRPAQGPLQLLNAPELEARIDVWLRAAGWTREACGRWIFTWNAFKIECDPQSVIETLATFELRPSALRDGAPYSEAGARGPGVLRREARGSDGASFVVELEVDPEAARRERAEADAVVREIMGEDEAFRSAFEERAAERAAERISGTIRIRFETDAEGHATRRTKVTELMIEGPGQRRETQTTTETVERRLVSGPAR